MADKHDKEEDPIYITVPEAARMFNISEPGAYIKARNEWHDFTLKLGGSVRINKARLLEWARKNEGRDRW
jgi:hypothetical protein